MTRNAAALTASSDRLSQQSQHSARLRCALWNRAQVGTGLRTISEPRLAPYADWSPLLDIAAPELDRALEQRIADWSVSREHVGVQIAARRLALEAGHGGSALMSAHSHDLLSA
jgi:hypothetical protein